MADKHLNPDINYELYKVFYYVATSLSFSEASKKLYISQSAVSQSIKLLEKKLDRKLFIRTTKKVTLTPAGELLLSHIEPAINLIRRGEDTLSDEASMNDGQLRIGASDTICRYYLVPYLKQFHQKYPDVPIRITNATSYACVDLLEHGEVDLIIVNYPNSRVDPVYIRKTIDHFQDVFVGNPNAFRLPEKPMTLRQINKYPIMTLDMKSTTTVYLRKLYLKHQLELVPEIRLTSNDLLIDLAKIGLGLTFVPDFCVRQQSPDLRVIETTDKIPSRRIVAASDPNLPTNASVDAFLELLPSVEA